MKDPVAAIRYLGKNRKLIRFFKNSFFVCFGLLASSCPFLDIRTIYSLYPWAYLYFSYRKEVIQPQVPLRLPCYDFVPITTPALGPCLPCGLARILRAEAAFMT